MKKSTIINQLIFISAMPLLFNVFSCKSTETNEDVRVPYVIPDSLMKTLMIDTVKISNLSYAIKFNGAVDFNTDKVINIYPLISGTVQKVHVIQGDQVKAGQVLGTIKSAEVANYNAALINAEANVRLTSKQLDQQRELFKSGLASKVDITGAEVNYEQAIATRTAAQKILHINGDNPNGEYIIKSPIDGFIIQKNVTNDISIRTDNNAPMFTISNLKNIWVEANVYEENIDKVHEGDEADVSTIAYPGKVFKGKVDKLMNVLDPSSKVMKMKVILDNPGFILKPQMFAVVTVNNTENEQSVTISSSDLVFDHSQYYVIVLKGSKDVQIRPVDVSGINGKVAYIKSGVSKGDRLIASQAVLIYGSLNN
jgi:cobalt-zinc-cadmium efflux system membrane fusion protein